MWRNSYDHDNLACKIKYIPSPVYWFLFVHNCRYDLRDIEIHPTNHYEINPGKPYESTSGMSYSTPFQMRYSPPGYCFIEVIVDEVLFEGRRSIRWVVYHTNQARFCYIISNTITFTGLEMVLCCDQLINTLLMSVMLSMLAGRGLSSKSQIKPNNRLWG